jgi:hypothetical protein
MGKLVKAGLIEAAPLRFISTDAPKGETLGKDVREKGRRSR